MTDKMNLRTIIPLGLEDLVALRWQYEETGETDPEKWLVLANAFIMNGAIANAERCKAKANYFSMEVKCQKSRTETPDA
jgi:hypothetical protein